MNKTALIILCLWAHIACAQQIDSLKWKQVFADSLLTQLIDSALLHNADLRIAHLNVTQAEASWRIAKLAFVPSISLGLEGSISKAKEQSVTKTYNAPLTMQWELDLAGRMRGERRAAKASYWSTAETERAVRLQLVTAVASLYYQLAMLDENLLITRQNIDNARQTVQVMQTMKEVGMQNDAAVSQARSACLNIEASEQELLQQIQNAESAMRVLCGTNIDSIRRSALDPMGIVIDDSATYSMESLSERPDVRAAEYAFRAQTARVGVARSAFYPQLGISASTGWTNNLGEIINPGNLLQNAIATFAQPLFNRGQNRANLRIARAQQEQAWVTFNQSLLVAGTELSDALTACSLCRHRLSLRQQEVAAAARAYQVSREVMQYGSATYLEVLTAQQLHLQALLSLSTDRYNLIQGKINLYKALGGK